MGDRGQGGNGRIGRRAIFSPKKPAELIAVTRNWAKSYVLWALATDPESRPVCGWLRQPAAALSPSMPPTRLDPSSPSWIITFSVRPANSSSRVRSASPATSRAGTQLRDVAFRNPNGDRRALHLERRHDRRRQSRIGFTERPWPPPSPPDRWPRSSGSPEPLPPMRGYLAGGAVMPAAEAAGLALLGNHIRLRRQLAPMAGSAGHRTILHVDL